MKFSLYYLLLLLFIPSLCFAQDCSLKIADAPEVRGLKLGMTYDAVKGRFNRTRLSTLNTKSDEFGFLEGSVFFIDEPNSSQFSGLERVNFQFLDDKLTSIEFTYGTSLQWRDPDEFSRKIAEALKLPTIWRDEPFMFFSGGISAQLPNPRMRALECLGFALQVDVTSSPKLRIYSTTMSDTIEKRKRDKEKKQKEIFRP